MTIRYNRLPALSTAIAGLLLLAACETTRPALAVQDEATKTQEKDGATLTLTFLDENTLLQRHGPEAGNPFIFNRPSMASTRIMVFELKLANSTDDPLMIRLNEVELRYGGRSTAPTNRFQLVEHWNWRRDIDDPRAYEHNNKVQVTNRHTLTDRVRIPARGGIVSGYLVFVANLPRTGTADLFIPLQSESGRGLQTFEVSYQF